MRAQRRLALWLLLASWLHHAAPMPLGVTLPELNEFGVLWPFADLVKQAAPPSPVGAWSAATQTYAWAPKEAFTAWSPDSGYPLAVPAGYAVLLRVAPQPEAWTRDPATVPAYAPGRYTLSWRGQGALRLSGDVALDTGVAADADAAALALASGAALPPVTVSLSNSAPLALLIPAAQRGITIAITATNASDHLRGLQLLPAALQPAADSAGGRLDRGAAVFSPPFLALARRFALLRFTAWQREAFASSAGAPLPWASRPTPGSVTQVGPAGVALEHCVDAALATNASAWFALPRRSDGIAAMAALLATQLLLSPPAWVPAWPGDVYVEYSAELGLEATQAGAALAAFDAFERGLQDALDASDSTWTYAALRSRFKLVIATRPGYLPNVLALWAPAALGAPHPFWRADALAISAALQSVVGDDGWESPGANVSFWAAQSDEALLAQLRHTALTLDADLNAAAQRAASFSFPPGANGDDPAAAGTAATQFVAGLAKPLRLLAFDVGTTFRAPDFGARFWLPSSNATDAQRAAAAAEAAWAERLVALHRSPAVAALLTDQLRRLAASGYHAAVAADAMRPPSPHGFAFSLQLRRSGNAALAEGWRSGYAAYAAAACGPLPDAPRLQLAFAPPPQLTIVNLTLAAAAALLVSADAADCLVNATAAASPKLAAVLAYAAQPDAAPATSADLPVDLLPAARACVPLCAWGVCSDGACVCFAGASGADCAILTPSCAAPAVGMNLAGLADWSTELLYVDAQRMSRAWISQAAWPYHSAWSWGDVPPTDAQDYPVALQPGMAVGTMMLRDLQGHYPAGWYAVAWDGDGVVTASMTDVAEVRRDAPGRMRVRMQPGTTLNNGLFLRVERSAAANPVRNIRVVMPFPGAPATLDRDGATEAAGGRAALAKTERVLRHAALFPFHPAVLHLLRNYSVLRFMDLMATNSESEALPVTWQDRPQRGLRTYTLGAGLPVDDVALLCNTLGAHAWVNVPHTADDGFVRSMAAALRDSLRPELRVYVELSNEVWGTGTAAGRDFQARGVATGADALSPPALRGADEARFCFYALRSRAVFDIFEAEWTPARRGRLQFVVAAQAVNADVARRILACNGSAVAAKADVLAIAPYTSPFMAPLPLNATSTAGWTADSVIADAFPADLARVDTWLAEHAAVALAYNLTLAAYECGQALLGATAREQALATDANRHPGMAGVYGAYLALLARRGVGPAMLFSSMGLPSRYGAWGLLEAIDFAPEASAKYYGVQRYLGALPADAGGLQCTNQSIDGCPAGVGDGGAMAACSGRGQCMQTPQPGGAGRACSCHQGWTGAACSVGATLDFSTCSYQCSGHGTCALARTDGFRRFWACACNDGYAGDRCTIFACPAHCSWNGRCVAAGRCACYDGFGGDDCSVDCGTRGRGRCAWQAGVNGSAVAANAPPAAICDDGYRFVSSGSTMRSPADGSAWFAAGACEPVCSCALATQRCLRPGVCSCPAPCRYGDCLAGACACWAGYGGKTCSRRMRPHEAAANGGFNALFSPMGVNLAGLSYWSTETPMCDLMRTASSWQTQYKEPYRPSDVYTWHRPADESPQHLAATGWPARLEADQALAVLLARDVQQALPNGTYVVTYDGRGELGFGFDARVLSERRGRLVLDVRLSLKQRVPDNGILLRVEDTDPADPIRNVKVFMPLPSDGGGPSCEDLNADGFPFHPEYVAFLRGMGFGALRFMDMALTNGAGGHVASWAQRPTVAHASWGEGSVGVPAEVMLHLANVLGADAWLNAPHAAGDEYHEALATLVRDTLRPDLAVYLERSNEAWNTLFDSGKALYAEADALGIAAPELHARKSAAMARAWERVWGADQRQQRLVHVLSTFTANPWYTGMMLRNASNLATVDALGVTAYIDCGALGSRANAQATALRDADWVLRRCMEELPGISNNWAAHQDAIDAALNAAGAAMAPPPPAPPAALLAASSDGSGDARNRSAWRRIALAVYEGGPGLVEDDVIQRGPIATPTPGLEAIFTAASRADAMESVYRAYLDSFGLLGLAGGRATAHPYMHFSSAGAPSRYGAWGLLESTGQAAAASPKARAVATFIADVVANVTRTGCMEPAATNFDPRARFPSDGCAFGAVAVTPLGATLQPGGVALSVPAGALAADVPISVAQVPVTLSADATSSSAGIAADAGAREVATAVFRFGPAGTAFDAPVEACVSLDAAELLSLGLVLNASAQGDAALMPGGTNATMGVALYFSADGVDWTLCERSAFRVASTGNASAVQLCGQLWHFTLVAGLAVPHAQLTADRAGIASPPPPPVPVVSAPPAAVPAPPATQHASPPPLPAASLPPSAPVASPPAAPAVASVTTALHLGGLASLDADAQAALTAALAASMGVAAGDVTVVVTDFPVSAESRLSGVTLAAWTARLAANEAAFATGMAADAGVDASAVEVGTAADVASSQRRRLAQAASAVRVPFALRGFGVDSSAAAAAAARVSAAAAGGASGLALALSAAGLPVAAVALPRAPLVSAAVAVTVRSAGAQAASDALLSAVAAGGLATQLAAAGINAVPTVAATPPPPRAAAQPSVAAPMQRDGGSDRERPAALAASLSVGCAALAGGITLRWWRRRRTPRGAALLDDVAGAPAAGKPRAQLLVDFAASAGEEDAPAHARTPRASGMRSRRVSDAAGRDSDGGRAPRRSDVALALAVDGGDAPRVSRTSRA